MCDIHLVEKINEERTAASPIRCDSCGKKIKAGERYRHVEGHLDDGSPGRWAYMAHEDCYWADLGDVHEDGCFTWSGAKRISA